MVVLESLVLECLGAAPAYMLASWLWRVGRQGASCLVIDGVIRVVVCGVVGAFVVCCGCVLVSTLVILVLVVLLVLMCVVVVCCVLQLAAE